MAITDIEALGYSELTLAGSGTISDIESSQYNELTIPVSGGTSDTTSFYVFSF